MSGDKNDSASRLSRRGYLSGGAALFTAASLAGCSDSTGGSTGSTDSGDDPVTVGVIDSQSGNAALTGTPKVQASELAVEEINAEGGINGREIELLTPDPESDINTFQQHARRLINEDNVDALWCGIRSSVREAVRPIVDENEQLYFYTTQYEGGVCDSYTFCMGATARQQLAPVMENLTNEYGSDIYTIAADYNFGQLSADWIEVIADEIGANVIGETFVPLSQNQFGSPVNEIQEADPDYVMAILVGANHTSFYETAESAGLDLPIGSSTTMGLAFEHRRLSPPALENVHIGTNYMEEIDTERNNDFVDRYYEKFPDAEYLNQSAHNNYFSMYMYKQAVEEAGTTDQPEVISTLEDGMEISTPEGDISLNGETHHMSHNMRIGRADENHEISYLNGDEGELIEPSFLQEIGCDLTEEEETTQYTPADL
jgi:branched-chain amino acid transport system substrate-binding protein